MDLPGARVHLSWGASSQGSGAECLFDCGVMLPTNAKYSVLLKRFNSLAACIEHLMN